MSNLLDTAALFRYDKDDQRKLQAELQFLKGA